MGLLDGFFGLSKDLNKVKDLDVVETSEGVFTEELPELELKMSDDELLALKRKWEAMWLRSAPELRKKQDENEKYWMGKHYTNIELQYGDRPLADNIIFEALETFLPIATRQNPQPVVESENTEEGQKLADRVQKMLAFLADTLRLKLKLKRVVRYWALYYVGIAKVGWNEITNDVDLKILRPQKLILDPDATITEGGEYTGNFIGEVRKDSVSNIIKKFPKKQEFFTKLTKEKFGSEVQYTEWWTNEYVFWTYENEVLDKGKNPHWNYEQELTVLSPFGTERPQKIDGKNHFSVPKKPYIFLSIFNLGKHPYDDISLVEQNLAVQDLINKRLRQIDKNADSMNGGSIVSGDHFTKEEADRVDAALRQGGTIWIPRGSVDTAYRRETGKEMPNFIYQSLLDYRNELRNIFGVRGSTPQGIVSEQTVRGKLITRGQDESRIGGGITEYLEQFADQVFNWFLQLMYVYYDEPHFASVLGKERAKEYITIKKSDLNRKLLVSVKEGSLIPKDPLTKRNEAIDLWTAGALDPITLFDRLEFPDPRGAAKRLYEWRTNPAALFPDLQQAVPMGGGEETQMRGKMLGRADLLGSIPSEMQNEPLSQVPIS